MRPHGLLRGVRGPCVREARVDGRLLASIEFSIKLVCVEADWAAGSREPVSGRMVEGLLVLRDN